MDWSEIKYFTEDEMRCQCGCGQAKMDHEFMQWLDALRDCYGSPIIISSGYRCKDHPIEAVKTKPGAHTTGKAADIGVDRTDAMQITKIALELGFTGVGIQQKGTGRFIHLDRCTAEDGFPRPTMWSY